MSARQHLYPLIVVTSLVASCAESGPAENSTAERELAQAVDKRAQLVEERTKLAASGLFQAPRAAAAFQVTPAEGQALVNALDVPAELNPTFVSLVSPDIDAAFVRHSYGVIQPTHHDPAGQDSFLILSTGVSGNETITAEPGTDFAPVGPNAPEGDVVTLRFQVTVPPGVNRMSFDYNFLSAESPDFVGTRFNDTFTATVSDALGADRLVATASVNSSVFHDASDVAVGPCPFQLYVDNPAGVNTVFNQAGFGVVDAGTTGFQRVDVPVASGLVTITFDIRDLSDGILDSAVIIDNLQFSSLEVVDPHRDLLDTFFGRVFRTPDARLATGGTPARAVTADGVTQLLLRSNVPGPGTAVFSLPSGAATDGNLSADDGPPVWGSTAITDAVLIGGKWFVFALYRSPADFNRGTDVDLVQRTAPAAMDFTPTAGSTIHQEFTIGIVRPPVVVVPDIWSTCDRWFDHGAIGDPIPTIPDFVNHYHVECANYLDTSSKSFLTEANSSALAVQIERVLQLQRGANTAGTRVDVIGHGMGGLLARRYIDDPSFVRFDNFKAGDINRLITMNTPNLGSRLIDEFIRVRDVMKQNDVANGTTTWPSQRDALADQGIHFDDATLDVALQEMGVNSSIVNAIAATPAQPSSVAYHAIYGSSGHTLKRSEAYGLLPAGVSFGMKNYITLMESTHPASKDLPQTAKRSLVYGLQEPLNSIIFCNGNPTPPTDEHDLVATTWEQQGGLAPQFTSQVAVDKNAINSGHYNLQNNPDHTRRLLELLDAPINGGLFATSMPSPGTVPRANDCPILPPLLTAMSPAVAAPIPLVQHTISITSPLEGTTVTPGSLVSVTVATDGGEQPEQVLILSTGSSELLDAPPFTASVLIPPDAFGVAPVRAMAFYSQGRLAFAPPVRLNVLVTATVSSLSVINGSTFLRRPGTTLQVSVVGTYSDGVRRNVTQPAFGSRYVITQLGPFITVSPEGLITAVNPGTATLAVTNGAAVTSINVTVGEPSCGDGVVDPGEQCDDHNRRPGDGCDPECQLENRPPVAVCTSPTVCTDPGVCSANVTNLGAGSSDPDGDALSFVQSPAAPYSLGSHQVSVTVSDGSLNAQCVSQLDVHDCESPSLTCPAAFAAECTGSGRAPITPPAATATDNCGSVTIQPPAAASFPLGTNTLSYAATDPAGNRSTCTTAVTVRDTVPPTISCPRPIVAECEDHASAFVTPKKATSSDVCTTPTVTGPAAGYFPLGTSTVKYTSTDQSGNQSTCNSTIQVVDTDPPYVHSEHVIMLSPPDHSYRTVHLSDCDITIRDACEGRVDPSTAKPKITCVTSDEPDDAPGNGDGNTDKDIIVVDDHTVKLRAERDSNRNGRRYKIEYQVQDPSGNRAYAVCRVNVPLNASCASDPAAAGCEVADQTPDAPETDAKNRVCTP